MDDLRGEQLVLKEMLNSTNIAEKTEALKRVVVSMTIGKNVSNLFQHVIKCLELPNLETKKIVYLYIINNSKNCPDDALMVISQFCKDIRDKRPIIRALAIRTMGYLRVAKLNEYLIDPLIESLRDVNAYVRKTAVNCVPKVLEVSRELIESKDITSILRDIIETDINPSVVAAAFLSEKEIHSIQGKPITINSRVLVRLLSFCDSFSDFEQIYVFEILAEHANLKSNVLESDRVQIQELISDKILPKLNHCNKALVISVVKLLLKFYELSGTTETEKGWLLGKIAKSLQSLINLEEEVSLIVAQTFLVLNFRYPQFNILKDPTVFFCRSEDSISLKILKLKLIKKSTTASSSIGVFEELISYFKSTDLTFSKAAVRCAFKIAQTLPTKITFNKLSQKIGEMGLHFLKTQNLIILEEIFAGFSDLLFSFTESISKDEIGTLFQSEKSFLRLVQALADQKTNFVSDKGKLGLLGLLSFLPISNLITSNSFHLNSESIFYRLVDGFFNETEEIQLGIVYILVRLYILEIEGSDVLLTSVFERITNECRSILVKDQAFYYWRLLSKDTELAQKVLFQSNLIKSESSQKIAPNTNIDIEKISQHVDIRAIGTFLSYYSTKKSDVKAPLFLMSDNFQFRPKTKDRQNKINMIEKRLLFEKERAGKKGRNSFEIMGVMDHKNTSFFICVDFKNTSNLIHEILNIKLGRNQAGFKLDSFQINQFKSRCIQKNEICMIELFLTQSPEEKTSIDNHLTSLHLDLTLETNLDEYDFKIQYPFALLLNENGGEVDDQKIDNLISSTKTTSEKLSFESYEENLNKFAKFFESNRIHKTTMGGFYFMKMADQIISAFKIDKKMDSDIEIILFVFEKNLQELIKGQISFLINLI